MDKKIYQIVGNFLSDPPDPSKPCAVLTEEKIQAWLCTTSTRHLLDYHVSERIGFCQGNVSFMYAICYLMSSVLQKVWPTDVVHPQIC